MRICQISIIDNIQRYWQSHYLSAISIALGIEYLKVYEFDLMLQIFEEQSYVGSTVLAIEDMILKKEM